MEQKVSREVTLTKEEVLNAVVEYLDHYLGCMDIYADNVTHIEQVTRRESIPGSDIHDCDWIEHFDGLKIRIEE